MRKDFSRSTLLHDAFPVFASSFFFLGGGEGRGGGGGVSFPVVFLF